MSTSNARRIEKTSRFAVMARRPGGVSRDQALARAEATIDKQKDNYLEWVVRDLNTLESYVNAIHDHEGARDEDMEAAYSKTAQIRDLGATFGFPLTTEVADSLCELLHRMRHARMYRRGAVQTHLEALKLVCTEAFKGKQPNDEKPLLDGLGRVLAKYPAVTGNGP
jgi:hypothetical protein